MALHTLFPLLNTDRKVYIGRTMDSMMLALHDGLNNDTIAETFDLQRPNEAGLYSPIRFVKIVPLSWVPMSLISSFASSCNGQCPQPKF